MKCAKSRNVEELGAAPRGRSAPSPGCRAASSATMRGEAEPTWCTCSSALGRPAMKAAYGDGSRRGAATGMAVSVAGDRVRSAGCRCRLAPPSAVQARPREDDRGGLLRASAACGGLVDLRGVSRDRALDGLAVDLNTVGRAVDAVLRRLRPGARLDPPPRTAWFVDPGLRPPTAATPRPGTAKSSELAVGRARRCPPRAGCRRAGRGTSGDLRAGGVEHDRERRWRARRE